MSNDNTEGALVSEAFRRVCLKDNLEYDCSKFIENEADGLQEMTYGKGFCLSKNGNLLSQWRAYGKDGTGFSIGFSTSYLKRIIERHSVIDPSMMLFPVIYDTTEHDSIVLPIYNELKELIITNPRWARFVSGKLAPDEVVDFHRFCSDVFSRSLQSKIHLYRLKHPAFFEEQEWRMVTLNEDLKKLEYQECNGIIKEFITLSLGGSQDSSLGDPQDMIISKLILGPRNKNSIENISNFLWRSGFDSVEISSSDIPYK